MLSPWKKSNDKPRQCIKKQRHYFAYKGPYSQSYGFSSSHVWMWELDNKKGWALKNLCLWTLELGKTLETPLDRKEIKPVNPKGNQHRIFIRRTNAETEAPIFWPSDVKSWLIGKDPDAERDWKQEETGSTEDEIVGWHHWLNGHEFEQTPGDSKGQEAWRAAVYGVAKSQTWLSDWTTTTYVLGEKKTHPFSLLLFLITIEKGLVKLWIMANLLFHVLFSEYQPSFMGSNSWFGVYYHWALRSRTNLPKRVN